MQANQCMSKALPTSKAAGAASQGCRHKCGTVPIGFLPALPQHGHSQESKPGMVCHASHCIPGPQLVSFEGGTQPQMGRSRCMSSAWHQHGKSAKRKANTQVKCIATEIPAEVARVPALTSSLAGSPVSTAAEASTAQAKEQEWQHRQALYASQAGAQTQQPGHTTPDLRAARAQRTLQMQILTTELCLCASWQDLQALFLEHRSRMNHIHLSALMVRLAQLRDRASSGTNGSNASRSITSNGTNGSNASKSTISSGSISSNSRISRAHRTAQGQQLPVGHKSQSTASSGEGGKTQGAGNQLRAFLAQLVPHVGMQLLTFGPRQLSNVMWALGKLGYTPGPAWITEWCGCAARKLDACSPQDLAMSAWGLAASGSVRPHYPTGAPLLMVQIARACVQPDTLAKCKLQDVSNIVWALATVGVAPEAPTLQALVHCAHHLLLQGSKLQTVALARALANASPAQPDMDLGNRNSSSTSSSTSTSFSENTQSMPGSSNSSNKNTRSMPGSSNENTRSIPPSSNSNSSNSSSSDSQGVAGSSSSKGVEGVPEGSSLSVGREDGVSQCAASSTHNLPFSNSLPLYSAPNPSHASTRAAAHTPSPCAQAPGQAFSQACATSPPSLAPSSEASHSILSGNQAQAVAPIGVQQRDLCDAPSSLSQAQGALEAHARSRHQQEQQEDGHQHHLIQQQQQQQQQKQQQDAVIWAPVAMSLKPQELCNLAWGLAKLQYHPGERFLSLLFTCFTQASRIAHATASSSSSVSSTSSSSSISSSSRRQHQRLMDDCPQHYANMLWSMAQLRYCPPSAEMAACLQGLLAPAASSTSHSAASASLPWNPGADGLGIPSPSTPATTTTNPSSVPPPPLGHSSSSSCSSSSSSSGGGDNSASGRGSVPRSYRTSVADSPLLQLHPRLKGVDVAHVLWSLGVLRYKPSPPLLRLILLHTHVALYGTAKEWGIVDSHGRNAATTSAASATASMEAKTLLLRGGAAAARVKERTHNGSAAAALTAATSRAMRRRQPLYAVLARMAQDRPQVGLSTIELVRTMWGLRQLFGSKPLPPTLAGDVAGAALALVPGYHELDPPSLMYLARGLASLGSTQCPPACGEALASAMDERLVNLNAHALAHIMASLAFLHYRLSPILWEHACARTGQLLGSSRGGIAAAPGSFGLTPSTRAAALGATAAATQAAVAAAAARVSAGPRSGSRSGTQLLRRRSRVLFASTMAGPRELALLLWGLAWTRGPNSRVKSARWANSAVHAASQAIASLGTEELRQLVWAVMRLRLKPWPLMGLRFEQACLARMAQLQQQGEPQPPFARSRTRRPRLTMTLLQQRRIRHWLLMWKQHCTGRRHKGADLDVKLSRSVSAVSGQMPAKK